MRFNTIQRLAALAAVAGISLLVTSSAVAQLPGANGRIAYSNESGGTISTISWYTPEKATPFAGPCCAQPAYSPDGQTITFVSQGEIFTQRADGAGGYRQLTNSGFPNWGPTFSPDGRKIVFSSKRADGLRAIWQMNADGSDQTQLTYPPSSNVIDTAPHYSPDGKTIAYASSGSDNNALHVYAMNADGKSQHRVEQDLSQSTSPSFSPDGKRITFVALISNSWSVYTMRADGTGVTRLTNGPANGDLAKDSSPVFSPDGDYVAFVKDQKASGS